MPVDASITLLTSLVSIGVVILLAGIPRAYTIHGRLATIEASLNNDARRADRLDSLAERLMKLEIKVDRAEDAT